MQNPSREDKIERMEWLTAERSPSSFIQVAQLRAALDNEREYDVPPEHDPSLLLLERTHQLGISTLFTEPIVYMMATEVWVHTYALQNDDALELSAMIYPIIRIFLRYFTCCIFTTVFGFRYEMFCKKEERLTVIKNIRAPYDEVGTLEAAWYPLALDAEGRTVDPEVNDNCDVELPDIDTPKVCRMWCNLLVALGTAYVHRGLGLGELGVTIAVLFLSFSVCPQCLRQDGPV